MKDLKIELKNTGVKDEEILKYSEKVTKIHNELYAKADDEKEFLGWLKLPTDYDKKEFKRIEKAAKKIQRDSDVFVVIGIGGSYLGARAVIEALTSNFANAMPNEQVKYPKVVFAGNNLNPDYINDIIEFIGDGDSNKEGYEEFVIPDNVGGRYSVLTAVGLLPIAVAGIDIDKLMQGALSAQNKYAEENLKYNDCYKYAVTRNILYRNKKDIELLVDYEPKLHYFIEWWKQLYGESEGKDLKGIFPAGVEFTTDLHSMGQYIQQGRRNLFETVLNVEKSKTDIKIESDEDNLDGLNYLVGKTLDYVNKKAMEATISAHVDGDVPNILISMEKLDEENLGQLIYFFELACAMSGKLLGVNPFDQPGVEAYKTNMFKLLGKPGYENK